jgi:hypothetical protein
MITNAAATSHKARLDRRFVWQSCPVWHPDRGRSPVIRLVSHPDHGRSPVIKPILHPDHGRSPVIRPVLYPDRGRSPVIRPVLYPDRGGSPVIRPFSYPDHDRSPAICAVSHPDRGGSPMIRPVLSPDRGRSPVIRAALCRRHGKIAAMKQKIVGFHQDEDHPGDEGVWVAELACGHGQHVRHQPPFVNRPWVLTAEGRARFLGFELVCKRCDEETDSTG